MDGFLVESFEITDETIWTFLGVLVPAKMIAMIHSIIPMKNKQKQAENSSNSCLLLRHR